MKDKIKYSIIILLVSLVVCIPLFWKNLNVYYDDGIQHIVRGFLTSNAIKSGENTLVLSKLANGFGYSWDLFYGPLSSFSIGIITLLTNNAIVSYKIVLYLGLLLSGITMFFFSKKITDDKNVALFTSVLYMTMPYHLTDMYLRNALGEFLSFIFIPLVFLGLYKLYEEEKMNFALVIGAVRTYYYSQSYDYYYCYNFSYLYIN